MGRGSSNGGRATPLCHTFKGMCLHIEICGDMFERDVPREKCCCVSSRHSVLDYILCLWVEMGDGCLYVSLRLLPLRVLASFLDVLVNQAYIFYSLFTGAILTEVGPDYTSSTIEFCDYSKKRTICSDKMYHGRGLTNSEACGAAPPPPLCI